MGNYSEVEALLRRAENARILILDSNNLQFYHQHCELLPQAHIFSPYEVVLIPGWVHEEYAHHRRKSEYVASIHAPTIILEETDDYLPMLGYSDKKLLELFRLAAPFGDAQKFFNYYRRLEADELPDDWIQLFYNQGFSQKDTGGRITRKNAGEVSILALCFCLSAHYPTQIGNISLATSDLGSIKIKERILKECSNPPLDLRITEHPPISFLTTDVSLFRAVQAEIITPNLIPRLRPNARSSQYIEHHPDSTSSFHQHVLSNDDFVSMCRNTNQYSIIF
ncbi:MAG: hypothetical protein K0R57_129 [Paenibacillaceae bacterium]|jgi:hypothetical protein|nr:hypothetical protein [Paenibacillaceae bacterium]